jgi:hypothetical protein
MHFHGVVTPPKHLQWRQWMRKVKAPALDHDVATQNQFRVFINDCPFVIDRVMQFN